MKYETGDRVLMRNKYNSPNTEGIIVGIKTDTNVYEVNDLNGIYTGAWNEEFLYPIRKLKAAALLKELEDV